MSVAEDQAIQLDLFEFLFGHDTGYVCLATTRPPAQRDTFQERFFEWPKQQRELIDFIEMVTPTHNVYFCVNLLSAARRRKDNAIPLNLVWADLDTCRPDQIDIPPQCVIESSPRRYQAIWRMDQKVDPLIAESYSKRIAYHHAELGADKSGFDLTQLLRVPGTYNFKYQLDDAPRVHLISMLDDLLPVAAFDALPQVDRLADVPDIGMPEQRDLPTTEMIIHRYKDRLQQTEFSRYYTKEPTNDWSKYLWRLINLCFDIGMTAEETFVIAKTSKCNKYERDNRPESHLWREVLKAELENKSIAVLLEDHRKLIMPALLVAQEEEALQDTIIDDYMSWATNVTDAVPDFHEICAAMVLSSLMSTTLRLQTSNATIVPNLWALVLGESTLTRKTTAMDMAMDLIMDVDRNLLLTSDASAEGLLSALSTRPKMVSIFYRDEVTGFFDAINRKEYLASMPEIMTKMYDVPKYMPRTLRKETFIVAEPIFIFFGGGVPDKMFQLVHEHYFTSGFMPRFLIMHGEADPSRIRPIGPPVDLGVARRSALLDTFVAFHSMYTDQRVTIDLHDGQKMSTTAEIQVRFTDAMWQRAAEMERTLITAAVDSPETNKAAPVFSRMYVSMLKLTMLLAAARQEPTDFVVQAEMRDLISAASYIQRWGTHSVHLIANSGTTQDESRIRVIYNFIEKTPGVQRGDIMQRYRLNARDMQLIEETLIQRDQIRVKAIGTRGKQYWPIA
jgi:hypothetical protein